MIHRCEGASGRLAIHLPGEFPGECSACGGTLMKRPRLYYLRMRCYSRRRWLDYLAQLAAKAPQNPAGPPPRPKTDGEGRRANPTRLETLEAVAVMEMRCGCGMNHVNLRNCKKKMWVRGMRPVASRPNPSRSEHHVRRPPMNPGHASTRFSDVTMIAGAVALPAPLILQVFIDLPVQMYQLISLVGGLVLGGSWIRTETSARPGTRNGGPR